MLKDKIFILNIKNDYDIDLVIFFLKWLVSQIERVYHLIKTIESKRNYHIADVVVAYIDGIKEATVKIITGEVSGGFCRKLVVA